MNAVGRKFIRFKDHFLHGTLKSVESGKPFFNIDKTWILEFVENHQNWLNPISLIEHYNT